MKPFNLEEAKAGKPVVTRNGTEVRIICFDRKNFKSPLIALLKYEDSEIEITTSYTEKGEHISNKEKDLFMKTEKKTGWVNIYYQHLKTAPQRECGDVFSSKENAIVHAKGSKHYITTIQIDWEE